MKLVDFINEMEKIACAIDSLKKRANGHYGNDCENIKYNKDNLDELFLFEELANKLDLLDDVNRDLKYLTGKVIAEGIIRHNADKRYELPNGHYFASGDVCEILAYSDYQEKEVWHFTSIEHNGEDYYATALGRSTNIDGMKVRVRGKRY